MRIGMVTAVYKPVVNGVTHMVALYRRKLEELGHEVTVFTLGEPDPEGDETNVVRSPGVEFGGQGYFLASRYTRQAQKMLREMDILHAHHLFMSVDMAHRYASCPIVYTNHTRYDLYTGTYMPLPQPAADAVMRQIWPEFTDLADVVVTPSASVRDVMIDFGVRQPIRVIENGVELDPFIHPAAPKCKSDFDLEDEDVLLIYVGRVSEEKNLDVLLEQFAVAATIVPRVRLLIVGKGPAEEDLRKRAAELDLLDRVIIHGPVAFDDVPNVLAAADIFVTASVSEVHPLTVIEAMASGLPVAASKSPGIVDIVENGRTGFLAPSPEKGLAAAIVGLASNDGLRNEMSVRAREASRQYDIAITVEKTVQLYDQLRQERPDLNRERSHGRWYRDLDKLTPKLEQLVQLIRPQGSNWRFFGPDVNSTTAAKKTARE